MERTLGYFCSPNIHQDPHERTEMSPGVPLQPCEGLGVQKLWPRVQRGTHAMGHSGLYRQEGATRQSCQLEAGPTAPQLLPHS